MRFGNLGGLELVIILAVLVLIFGVGRLSKIGSELGSGIRNFREAVSGDDEADQEVE